MSVNGLPKGLLEDGPSYAQWLLFLVFEHGRRQFLGNLYIPNTPCLSHLHGISQTLRRVYVDRSVQTGRPSLHAIARPSLRCGKTGSSYLCFRSVDRRWSGVKLRTKLISISTMNRPMDRTAMVPRGRSWPRPAVQYEERKLEEGKKGTLYITYYYPVCG